MNISVLRQLLHYVNILNTKKKHNVFICIFLVVKIIDFKNNFISAVLPCYKDLDCIFPS